MASNSSSECMSKAKSTSSLIKNYEIISKIENFNSSKLLSQPAARKSLFGGANNSQDKKSSIIINKGSEKSLNVVAEDKSSKSLLLSVDPKVECPQLLFDKVIMTEI